MIKKLTRFQLAALKRTMKNITPLTRKKETLEKQLSILIGKIHEIDTEIAIYKNFLDPITGGVDPETILACNGEFEVSEGDPIPETKNISMELPVEEIDYATSFEQQSI